MVRQPHTICFLCPIFPYFSHGPPWVPPAERVPPGRAGLALPTSTVRHGCAGGPGSRRCEAERHREFPGEFGDASE